MASRYEVEVTVGTARDLKNVNWRNGDLKPYVILWVDSGNKTSTRVDLDGDEHPTWDEKVLVPLPPQSSLDDAVLYVDVVHANADEGVKPLVGSARLPLRNVLDDAGGVGGKASRMLCLKRPSGRPHGKLDVRVAVKEPARYYDPSPYPAPGAAYSTSRDTYGAGAYGSGGGGYGAAQPYTAAPPTAGYGTGGGYGSGGGGYGAAPPTAGYPSAYGSAAPPAQPAYGGYGGAPPVSAPVSAPPVAAPVGAADPALQDPNAKKKGSKMGAGTGVVVGAAAGLLGGLALAGGASYLENKFEDHETEKLVDREDSYGGGGYEDDDY
jgi:hypothetical protein